MPEDTTPLTAEFFIWGVYTGPHLGEFVHAFDVDQWRNSQPSEDVQAACGARYTRRSLFRTTRIQLCYLCSDRLRDLMPSVKMQKINTPDRHADALTMSRHLAGRYV